MVLLTWPYGRHPFGSKRPKLLAEEAHLRWHTAWHERPTQKGSDVHQNTHLEGSQEVLGSGIKLFCSGMDAHESVTGRYALKQVHLQKVCMGPPQPALDISCDILCCQVFHCCLILRVRYTQGLVGCNIGISMVQRKLCTTQGNCCHQTCSPALASGTSSNIAQAAWTMLAKW